MFVGGGGGLNIFFGAELPTRVLRQIAPESHVQQNLCHTVSLCHHSCPQAKVWISGPDTRIPVFLGLAKHNLWQPTFACLLLDWLPHGESRCRSSHAEFGMSQRAPNLRERKKHININNIFTGLSRDWVGAKKFVYAFFGGSFLMGEKKHI